MDFVALTIEILNKLAEFAGSYGMAIVIFTILMRMCLWTLNVSQQRSMKNMQNLAPKLKMIQEKYKNNPQLMQQKMMEFYKEHKFNPMAGCLPILIQMPIFILLYTALISPQFISEAGNSQFLFIKRLDTTLRGTAAPSFDGAFSVSKGDSFTAFKKVIIKMGEEEINNSKILAKNAVKVQGQIVPTEPIDLKIDLDDINLKFTQLEKVTGAVVDVQNVKTREVETVNFEKNNGVLTASMPTAQPTDTFNFDVLILIVLFAATICGLSARTALYCFNSEFTISKSSRGFLPSDEETSTTCTSNWHLSI